MANSRAITPVGGSPAPTSLPALPEYTAKASPATPAEIMPVGSTRPVEPPSSTTPQPVIVRVVATMNRRVTRCRNHPAAKSPAKIGGVLIEMTVPTATPVWARALKKHSW